MSTIGICGSGPTQIRACFLVGIADTDSPTGRERSLGPKEIRLKKHAQVVLMHGKLSLVQHKISNALLMHAYHDLPEQAEHTIYVVDLCRIAGYTSTNHVPLRKALRGLISTLVEEGDPWMAIRRGTPPPCWHTPA